MLGHSAAWEALSGYPLTPTGGMFVSSGKSLELIWLSHNLGFYKPVRFEK